MLRDFKELKYIEIVDSLKKNGIDNITVSQRNTDSSVKDGMVSRIFIDSEEYKAGDCYLSKSAPITIEHFMLPIEIGRKASSFEDKKYHEIVEELEEKGFVNIQLQRLNNLLNGWINKEGTIKSISINGKDDFSETESFYHDVPIIIVVYTFSDKGCEDITEVAK